MDEFIAGEHAHAGGTETSGLPDEAIHHKAMRLQQIVHAVRIELTQMLVSFVGVLHLAYVLGRREDTLAVDHIANLFQRERILLDCQRGMDGANSVLPAEGEVCGEVILCGNLADEFTDFNH